MSRFLSFAFAAILLVGCSGAASPQAQETLGPAQIEDVATEVPATPTAKPTPRPTPVPTPVPATGDQAAYMAFLERTVTFTGTATKGFNAISDAADYYDLDTMTSEAQGVRTAALTYIDWLDAHPARGCYKQVWSLSRQMAVDAAASMKEFIAFTTEFDMDAADRGLALLTKTTEETQRATAALESVSCPA